MESDTQGLSKDVQAVAEKLAAAVRLRKEFEEKLSKCQNWLQEAETAVGSDVKGSTNIDVLEEQFAKVLSLQ